jgi:hypothetical protein
MKKKEYIILLLVIAILSAYLLLKKRGSVHYSLPVLAKVNKDSIVKLAIKRGGTETTFKMKNNDWLILPEGSKAEKTSVNQMLKAIEELTLTSLVSESKNYAVYDLDEKNGVEVKAFDAGDNILRKMVVGKTAASFGHTLVTVGDDHKVYHAKGNIKNLFDKSASILRDKSVMSFSEDISEITINDGTKDILITKASAEAIKEAETEKKNPEVKWQTKDGKPVKKTDIDDIINTLKNLRCDNYIEGKKKVELKEPIYTVSLKGKKLYTIKFFKKEGSLHQATSSENGFPFLLAEWKVNKVMKDFSALTEEKE